MEKTASLAQTVPPSTRQTMNDDDVSESAKSSLPSKRIKDDMSEIKMSSSTTTDDNDCPLFMDGLQSNFAQNTALAALASLLDEEDDENNNDDDADISTDADLKKSFEQSSTSLSSPARTTHVNKSGGGKASKVTPRRNNYNPYSKGDKEKGRNENEEKKKKGAATLGEAQLFLNMWKL